MAGVSIHTDGMPPRSVALRDAVVTLGRSVDNVLEVPDANMSRRHCVIERRGDNDFILTDCNSSNGTRVNGERVISHELRDGDRIEVGSTVLVFSLDDDPPSESIEALAKKSPTGESGAAPRNSPLLAALEETPTGKKTTATQINPGDKTVPMTKRLGSSRPPLPGIPAAKTSQPEVAVLAHERDDLRKLLEINKRLNQQHDLRKLLETIIDSAIELMAAERGFLILVHEGEMKVEIARNLSREALSVQTANMVSTQICKEVIDTGKPVLTTNAAADTRYGRYSSVVGLNLHSILCVPFKIKDQVLGTVYLDNANVGAFSARDSDVLSSFSDQAAVAIENARLIRQVKKKERMEQELKIASDIQKKLLPRRTPRVPGLDLYGWMHPAKQVGGDYYDFIPVPGGILVCIGDVSGKGVPAGLVMASARSALRSLAERVTSTREIVIALNRLLADDLDREMFLSLLLMRYDSQTGVLSYTGAGHEHIIVYRAEENRVETRKAGGMVLGLTPDVDEHVKEEQLALDVGDALVLYTDGVTEAVDEHNEQYQLERLTEAVQHSCERPPREMLHAILSDVLKFKGKAQQKDDITLVTARRTPLDEIPPDDPPTVRRRALDPDENTDMGHLGG
jgi:serine phosphatase RsbU (regulator of sigma subunit)/pSer/pThr/pTyr-binding forkhead associated (FHA) protein